MKRIVTILLLVCCVLSVNAQNTAAAKKRVAEIKQMYAGVKERKQYLKDAELPPYEMDITNEYMAAGAGPIKEVYHYCYSGDFDPDSGCDVYEVNFITHSHNVGDIDFYEEYLFDKGVLAFYYEKKGDNETRYYFDKGKLVHSIVKGEESNWREMDADLTMLHRYAADTVEAFSLLMNRNY